MLNCLVVFEYTSDKIHFFYFQDERRLGNSRAKNTIDCIV